MKVKLQCPVCKKQVIIELPKIEDLTEFVVLHQDHAAKVYVDEHGFVRRAWPAKLLTAKTLDERPAGEAAPGSPGAYFAVAVGGGGLLSLT
ncbi:hypothetical protein [Pyrobaculum aerophilum]|uniref:Uncharacterized protein n=1 Tax=Pyrobaculum aerophilum TaxID=13773 RepID=A0A371QXZ9_9CREN|nr:hypothetical protein [Pyrobaculum aerophilum]RFA95563.1 hypothetical protein CGL52_12710 [Pyrobaculum aerophilum]